MTNEDPDQVSPTWQVLFSLFVVAIGLVLAAYFSDQTSKFLSLSSLGLIAYLDTKGHGKKLFQSVPKDGVPVSDFFEGKTVSAYVAVLAAIVAFSPMLFDALK